jgi:hypothetical protein
LGFIAFDLSPVLIHKGALLFNQLTRDGRLLNERVITLHIENSPCEQRLILLPDGDLLLQLRLQRPRIDDRKHIALLDVVTFLKQDLRDFAVDPALHVHGVEGLYCADAGQVDRHVLNDDRRCPYRNRRAGAVWRRLARRRRGRHQPQRERSK